MIHFSSPLISEYMVFSLFTINAPLTGYRIGKRAESFSRILVEISKLVSLLTFSRMFTLQAKDFVLY